MKNIVRKVLIPNVGLGTRFLHTTKLQPKETLLIVDRRNIYSKMWHQKIERESFWCDL